MSESTASTEKKGVVEVYESLREKIRVICARRQISSAEAFDLCAKPGIEREYRKVVKEMDAEIHGTELGENGAG